MDQKLTLPYGHGEVRFSLPSKGYLGTFVPAKAGLNRAQKKVISGALDNPIGTNKLEHLVDATDKVVIVTSDMTRPCPNNILLPPLLERLKRAGVPEQNITVVIGLGLHRKMTTSELRASVGDAVFNQVKVVNHDIDDVVPVGQTSRGTEVEVFKTVVDADFRICVGNVEFHYFAGFSGGAKAIVPGVSSRKTINANHSLMIKDEAVAARLDGNPVREDLEEAVDLIGVDFLFNVTVNEQHEVIDACAGDLVAAHRALCSKLAQTGLVSIPNQVDIAIVSAGGHPKDINLYQAQKGLDNCSAALRDGGVLILLAECLEGFGSDTFQSWITAPKTPADLLADIRKEFVLEGHKAAAIAKVAATCHIFLVTSEKLQQQTMVGIKVFPSVDEALQEAFQITGYDCSYALFPLGASTLPTIAREE